MLRHVTLVRTDVSEELSASFIRVTRIGVVTASVVPSSLIFVTLMKQALRSFETSVLTRATRRNIPEDIILHNYRRENFKSYKNYVNFLKGAESQTEHPCSHCNWRFDHCPCSAFQRAIE
jgi:hypothetical protein